MPREPEELIFEDEQDEELDEDSVVNKPPGYTPGLAYREITPLSDEDIALVVQQEIADAKTSQETELANQVERNLDYYYGRPFGNEVVGRSQVQLTDVADTVEWIMPSLMRMFFGGDSVVRYKARRKEGEEGAEQATEYVNQLYMNEHEGFLIGHDWMKASLIETNSVVKAVHEESYEPDIIRQKQMDELQLLHLLNEDDVEPIRIEELEETLPGRDPITGEPVELPTYDVALRRSKTTHRIVVENVPCEEFLIGRGEIRLNDKTRFSAHRMKRTVSELISIGVDPDVAVSLPYDDTEDLDIIKSAREGEDEIGRDGSVRPDIAAREVWLNECYIRIDADGDGFTELRKILCVGDSSIVIVDNDYANFPPFASIVPVPIPHKFRGLTIADLVHDLQKIRSTLLRQMMDNIYLSNNVRYAVVEDNVEWDDLMTSLPGAPIRMTAPGMVEPMITPPLNAMAFNMLEHLEGVKENRTGVTKYNQGLDAKSLNQTATGITSIMEAANARIELIARIFANSGLKRLFKMLLRLMVESPVKQDIVSKTGEWITVDPSTWDGDMEVEIEVGLGVGQAAERIRLLIELLNVQAGFVSNGMGGLIVTPENAYNAGDAIAKAMGFKVDDKFFTNPAGQDVPEPETPPEIIKAQIEAETKGKDRELRGAELKFETMKFEADQALKERELRQKERMEQQKIRSDERIALRKIEADLERARIQAEAQKEAAETNAQNRGTEEKAA